MADDPLRDQNDEDDALDETVADVDLDESLDQVDPTAAATPEPDEDLGEFDPEAGRSRIGGRAT
ncbi:MAG: hypothetical protein K8E66_06230, partial [Phycisphaerales bacterium]|nr:hypothetical protein [Phycisphaerales bacterium]